MRPRMGSSIAASSAHLTFPAHISYYNFSRLTDSFAETSIGFAGAGISGGKSSGLVLGQFPAM